MVGISGKQVIENQRKFNYRPQGFIQSNIRMLKTKKVFIHGQGNWDSLINLIESGYIGSGDIERKRPRGTMRTHKGRE